MKFTKELKVNGCSYVFQNEEEMSDWIDKNKPNRYKVENLPGLSVGDRCYVYGEGMDVFTITGVVKYGEHRYGFLLDGGDVEEVGKCHAGENNA